MMTSEEGKRRDKKDGKHREASATFGRLFKNRSPRSKLICFSTLLSLILASSFLIHVLFALGHELGNFIKRKRAVGGGRRVRKSNKQ